MERPTKTSKKKKTLHERHIDNVLGFHSFYLVNAFMCTYMS